MGDAERLTAIYRAAGKAVKSELFALDVSAYDPDRAEKALDKVALVVRSLNELSWRWVDEAVDRAYGVGARKAKVTLEGLGVKQRKPQALDRRVKIKEDLGTILFRANNSIVTVAEKFLALTAMAAREVRAVSVQEFSFGDAEAAIGKMARDAVKNEETRKTLAGQIRSHLRNYIGDDQFIEINGRMYDVNKYSMMVSRTTLREAQTAATLDLCSAYENDLVQWSDHGTRCPDCHQYEGQTYSISGKDPYYPPLTAEPPIHPNCEHSLLPTTRAAIDTRRAGLLPQWAGIPVVAHPKPAPEPPKPKKPRAPRKPKQPPAPANLAETAAGAPLKEFDTVAKCEDWAKNNLVRDPSCSVNYKKTDLAMANLLNRELNFVTQFGYRFEEIGVTYSQKTIMYIQRSSRMLYRTGPTGYPSLVGHEGTVKFAYNPKFAGTYQMLEQQCVKMNYSGWQLGHTPESIIQHEMGHALDDFWCIKNNIYWGSSSTRSATLYDNWRSSFPSTQEFMAEKEHIRDHFSGDYMWVFKKGTHTQNKNEFFAEAYRLYRQGRLPISMNDFRTQFQAWGW